MNNCEKCGEELDELYARNGSIFDLLVYDCPKCKAVYAYFVDTSKDDYDSGTDENTQPMNDHSAPLEKTCKKVKGINKQVLPKACATAYSKGVTEKEAQNKELNRLIESKLVELYKIGLSITTINLARRAVLGRIRIGTTPKQIRVMLAGAIYVKANSLTKDRNLWEHKGEGVSVRQLESIFSVTRKTISKSANTFYCPVN